MLYNPGICKIVIENIELLEEAPSVIEQIEKVVFKQINERFREFFKTKEDWKGDYTYFEEEGDQETWFLPVNWPDPNDEGTCYPFCYTFIQINAGEGYYNCLTALTGKTTLDKYAICLSIDRKNCEMNKKQLKDFLQKRYQSVPELQTSNVQLESEVLFIPICIDTKKLLEEYPDCDECLQPVDNALKNLMDVHPFIDKIVQEAQKK